MSEPLTDAELVAIRKRICAAVLRENVYTREAMATYEHALELCRDDVPTLLDEVERLKAELASHGPGSCRPWPARCHEVTDLYEETAEAPTCPEADEVM